MKRYRYLFLCFLCLLQHVRAQESAGQHTELDQFLQESGKNCNVYFTFEGSCPSNVFSDLMLGEEVSKPTLPGDINSVLAVLTNSMTNLTVLQDGAKKHIYHVIDKRLLKLGDYSMTRVLDSIKFEGDAWSFVNHIKEVVPNISNQNVFAFTGSFIIMNGATKVSVDNVNVSVRDALSDGLDLNGYSRLVWAAFTPLETHQTQVQFMGKTNIVEQYESEKRTGP